jgi:hypothetical protein
MATDMTAPVSSARHRDAGVRDSGVNGTYSFTASPTSVTVAPGGTTQFTLFATGPGNDTLTVNFTDPPFGVNEDTSIFLPLNGSDVVTVTADPDAVPTTGSQTFSTTVFNGTRTVDLSTSVQITVTSGGDDAGTADAGTLDAGSDGGSSDAGVAQDGGSDAGFAFWIDPPSITLQAGASMATTFTLHATGPGSGDLTLGDITDPPYGVSEDTSIFLTLNGPGDPVSAWADSSAPSSTGVQTFSTTVFDGMQSIDLSASIQITVVHR